MILLSIIVIQRSYMKVLKKCRIYFLIGAAFATAVSFILLLTTYSTEVCYIAPGKPFTTDCFVGTLAIFGGNGSVLRKFSDIEVVCPYEVFFDGIAYASPFGIMLFIGMLAIICLYVVAIWKERKKKETKFFYLSFALSLFCSVLIIGTPFAFLPINNSVLTYQETSVFIGEGWVAALVLLLVSSTAISAIYYLTKNDETLISDTYSVSANDTPTELKKALSIDEEKRILKLLQKYKSLLDEGAITQEEYDKKKSDLLG